MYGNFLLGSVQKKKKNTIKQICTQDCDVLIHIYVPQTCKQLNLYQRTLSENTSFGRKYILTFVKDNFRIHTTGLLRIEENSHSPWVSII